MIQEGNTAPPITKHLLSQLLLSIGLPFLIIPIVAAIGYYGFRYLRNRKSAAKEDVGSCAKACVSSSGSSGSENDSASGGGEEIEMTMMTPALKTNSVQVPGRA
ncbi:hypothetical protein Q7P37_000200 [Cladosporium fusiforme]